MNELGGETYSPVSTALGATETHVGLARSHHGGGETPSGPPIWPLPPPHQPFPSWGLAPATAPAPPPQA